MLLKNKFFLVLLLIGLNLAPIHVVAQSTINKNSSYQDFGAWYQKNYKLKALPFRAVALIDAQTLQPLYYYQESTTMPTASLMKMLAAGAFLSYGSPDWFKLVDLTEQENETLLRPYVEPKDNFALLRLKAGEKISLEQAFATMLMGSANNIAVALPRYLGISRTDFINRMQQTALNWGMNQTIVDEPSGLSLNNVSSAKDLALGTCQAFGNFMTSYYGSQPYLTYDTDIKTHKIISHTVHDVRNYSQKYWGAKTGYLRETQYHLAAGVITPQGRKLCLTVLTSPSRALSEQTGEALRQWADKMYQW
ncbi:serine hydrolase [Patescibacteria group bacterium]|nr:serine hydrolase [Patescibacteria group bacterium]